ncbi:MAG TPA: hypothetical protein VGT03_05825 [Candidatus Acidoferrales bacterium]|nr:hypothetical protein [Candidatus Acidoferrales bacterium]
MDDLAPVREPELPETIAGAEAAALPERGGLAPALGSEGDVCESMVRSASRIKSKEEPQFEQLDDCSSFSVRQ